MTATSRDDLERRAFESGATMRTSEVLYRAADLIEFRGWADRDVASDEAWGVQDATSPVCLEGGIIAAMGGEDAVSLVQVKKCAAYQAVHAYLGMPDYQRLYTFNDARGRTAEEVTGVLRAVAVIEAAKERSVADARAADAAIHPEAVR